MLDRWQQHRVNKIYVRIQQRSRARLLRVDYAARRELSMVIYLCTPLVPRAISTPQPDSSCDHHSTPLKLQVGPHQRLRVLVDDIVMINDIQCRQRSSKACVSIRGDT